jgi:NAD(P)-dependent dehydrogenase (short-subunit alcohol dehydrogenase family)
MLDLKGKTALVTGGGTGIGQSIALHLAQEGCHLVLTGLGIDDLYKTNGEWREENNNLKAENSQLRAENEHLRQQLEAQKGGDQ